MYPWCSTVWVIVIIIQSTADSNFNSKGKDEGHIEKVVYNPWIDLGMDVGNEIKKNLNTI